MAKLQLEKRIAQAKKKLDKLNKQASVADVNAKIARKKQKKRCRKAKARKAKARVEAKERANWDEFPRMPKEVMEQWKASNKSQSTLNFDLYSEEDQTQEV